MDPTWRMLDVADRPFACDDFWEDFDWERPEKGQEMRLVFSTRYVKGSQKTLVEGQTFVVIAGHPRVPVGFGMYMALGELIERLDPRDDFNVWWWPEYRDGEI